MKKIFKSFMALMSVVLLMASCDNASPVKSDYDPVFDESQKGYTFAASSQGATYGVGYEDSIYSVLVFRNYTEGEETVALQFGGDAQYFELPESVTFQDGQDVTSFDINVQGMPAGSSFSIVAALDGPAMTYCHFDSAALVAKFRKDSLDCIANSDAKTAAALGGLIASITAQDTIYLTGETQTQIDFAVEYTWVSKGIVLFVSEWEGAQGEVEIQQALEYSDAAGNHYMRLNSPYYHIAPDYCSAAGKHAYFYLDKDYNAGNDLVPAGIQPVEDAYGWYWSPSYVGVYNQFLNQGNVYLISVLWNALGTSSLYNPTNEMWEWDEEHYNAAKADPNWIFE